MYMLIQDSILTLIWHLHPERVCPNKPVEASQYLEHQYEVSGRHGGVCCGSGLAEGLVDLPASLDVVCSYHRSHRVAEQEA